MGMGTCLLDLYLPVCMEPVLLLLWNFDLACDRDYYGIPDDMLLSFVHELATVLPELLPCDTEDIARED